MENTATNPANESNTEDFDFKKHFVNASLGALYYLIVYIPFILPFKIWGKAATRISLLWENKSLIYSEQEKSYPLHLFLFYYIINFIFDAIIFLAWPVGLVLATYFYIEAFEFMPFFEGYVMSLFSYYISVLFIRAGKEALTYILNNLVVWLFDVFKNIGLFIKNMWLLNIVIKKK